MRPVRLAALLFLVLVLLTVVMRTRRQSTSYALPPAPGVTLLLVEKLSLTELRQLPGLSPNALFAVMPARAGKGTWDLSQTILTGSRSPLPSTAPRLAGVSQVADAAHAAAWTRRGGPLLIASLADGAHRFVPLCLQSAAPTPAPPALLTSPSTGFRPGLVAATDLAQTVLALRGEDTVKLGAGRSLVALPASPTALAAQLDLLEAQARSVRFLVALPWGISGLLLLAAWRGWSWLAHFCAALPLALLLAPLLVVGEAAFLVALPLAAAFSLGARRWGSRGLAWATLALLALDTLFSLGLLYRSPLSFSAAEAARFYGIGNETGGLLIGAALVAAGGELAALSLLGLGAALLLGAPTLGANAGCFLAMLAATGAALVGRAPQKVRLPLAVLALVLLVSGAAGVALWDASRGHERSHIGEAVVSQQSTLQELVVRKLAMNAHLTTTSPWALLFFLQLALIAYQKRWSATWDVALGAIAVWLLNDAGIVAGATCLLLTAPAREATARRAQRARRST